LSLTFSEDGPTFPNALVDAMLDGDVVFVCGAGVSAPQLPMFGPLVKRVFQQLAVTPTPGEQAAIDNFRFEEALGSLSRRLADPVRMYREVSDILTVTSPALEHHKTLLRLSRARDNRVILVTTNFDTFFERAIEESEGGGRGRSQSLGGQALPPPGSETCHGVIHLHGRVADSELGIEATPVVLTSAEYGDAYMRSGWASRFLFDLVRCKTIVLVGYSAGDAPVRYFLNLLEGDRARFEDLRTVYALDVYGEDPQEAEARWSTIAVTPLPFRSAEGADAYLPLWRDLAQLADLVERPRAARHARAAAILTTPFSDTTDAQHRELAWLLSRKSDLWRVVPQWVTDAAWFDHFQQASLLTAEQMAQVIADWCARDLASRGRLEAAIVWREKLARTLVDALRQRMQYALEDVARPWGLAWKALLEATPRNRHATMAQYNAAKALSSPAKSDNDLRRAIKLLTPQIQVKSKWRRDPEEPIGTAESIRDIVHVSLQLDDSSDMTHLNAAIRELPADSMRFAQLSTQALINTAYAAIDMDLLGPDWDALDRSVPSVEAHAQNAYQDGVVHLCVLLTDLLPILVERDVAYAANLARAWRSIPSVLGQRLWVHAQRSRVLFSSDQVAQNLLELPADAFWTMRRELVLAITERMGAASPHLIHHLLRRVLDESPTLYAEFSQGEGETDWRPQARSHRVWLLLTALKVAGVLPDEGVRVLADIAQQYPYIAGDFREEDLFGVYSSGVSSVQGDATTLIDAIPGERLQLAKQLISEADYEAQASWAAYCRAEPTAAFEVLRNADIDADNSRLWSDFLNVLVVAGLQETTRSIALDLMPKAFAKLSAAPEGVIVPLMPALTHLLPIRQATDDSDIFEQWWDRLWAIAEHHEDEFDLTTDCQRLLDRAINSSAGRLTERLLESVNRARLATGVSADDRKRLERTLEAREPARWMAGAICARSAGFILLVHPKAALRHLRRCLMKDDVEGRALRAVLLAVCISSFRDAESVGI